MTIALSGLASGIDTDGIISQLMAVERQPRTQLSLDDTKAENRQSVLKDLATRLGAVRDAATALRSTTTWLNTQDLTSSDAARVAISSAAGAGVAPGSHSIEVTALAATAQHAFAYTSNAAAQTLTIGSYSLNVDADSDAATVASALNADADAPVRAVVAGGKLVLTSRTSGAAGDFTVGASPLVAEDVAYARAGADAAYTIDGQARTSASNVITDAVLGATMTLKARTVAPVSIDVGDPGADSKAIQDTVQAFVTAYNSTVDFIRGKLSEQRVKDPATTTDAVKGLFNGDTMLSGVLSSMRSAIGDVADLGISTGAASGAATFSKDAVAGKLTFDATKLTAALTADPTAVRTRLSDLGDRLTTAVAPVAGDQITNRLTSVDSDRKRLADAMTRMDTRLADREKRLRAQFSAMESALAASQSAQAQLAAQLQSLG